MFHQIGEKHLDGRLNLIADNMQRNLIPPKKKLLIRLLKSLVLSLTNEIALRYIHFAFSIYTGGYEYQLNGDGQRRGCVLWKQEHQISKSKYGIGISYLRVLLICSENDYLNNQILKETTDYAIQNNLSYIELQPANKTQKAYYESIGYVSDGITPFLRKAVPLKN